MKVRNILACAVAAGGVGVALLLPAVANAGGNVKPGAECAIIGAVGHSKAGEPYRCERRDGETCGHWRWAGWTPGTPHTWSLRPAAPCPCSPSPSPSASPSTTASPAPSGSPSSSPTPQVSVTAVGTPTTTTGVPVGDQLPVTGGPLVPVLGAIGLGLLGFGALVLRIARRRTT